MSVKEKGDVRLEDNAKVESVYQNTTINNFYNNVDTMDKTTNIDDEVKLENCLEKYLTNAYKDYNQVKTLVSRDTPRNIVGEKEIYASIDVEYNYSSDIWNYKFGRKINTKKIESLLSLSKHILIEGTGGSGKTMLMKYFFLTTANEKTYIPVFVRLNKISEQSKDNISIYDIICSSIAEYSDELSNVVFKNSLEKGKYLFLFDGFDEIISSHSIKASIAIYNFCKRYPDNPCILTSRPGLNYSQFKMFKFVKMLPLKKCQAIELASKLGFDEEKSRAFCKQLDAVLYDKHEDFAKNPLLLSMMFLTFLENGSVPDRIVDFYDRAYSALYNNHDNFKDGYFERTFESSLKPNEFKSVFMHFCFQTYMHEKYYFDRFELITLLKKSLEKCCIDSSRAENYLNDLERAVCLIVEEGTRYVFTHRSFQAYFAALYTEKLNDETQRKLFKRLLTLERYEKKEDYYIILTQLMNEKFVINALEDRLRTFHIEEPITDEFMIKLLGKSTLLIKIVNGAEKIAFDFSRYKSVANCFRLFDIYKKTGMNNFSAFSNEDNKNRFMDLLKKMKHKRFGIIDYEFVSKSNELTEKEKREFWLITIRETGFDKFCQSIYDCLKSLDEKRECLKNEYDIYFFENL